MLDGTFLDRRENVLAFGNPGSGKTHLLSALGQELIRRGRRVAFSTCVRLVQDLLRAKQDLRLSRAIKKLAYYEALVIDDIGYVRRIDSSLLLPGAACCLMKNVTHPSGRDGQQIEEATECGDKA